MIDLASVNRDLADRIAIYGVGQNDLVVLERHLPETTAALPEALAATTRKVAAWPMLGSILACPELQEVRKSQWTRIIRGEIGEGYRDSANVAAQIMTKAGMPSAAAIICQAVLLRHMIQKLAANPLKYRLFGRLRAVQERHALSEIIDKLAWLDMGLTLKTFSDVDQAARKIALEGLEAFQAKTQLVVQAVGSGSAAVESGAQTVARSVEQTGERAAAAAAASDEASSNVLSVAGAAEQLSASIGEIAKQASRAADIAKEANAAVRNTDANMETLTSSAGSIGDVVGLISSIAAQTNLLALNATIEAARAGEAGKGFAVVATEVKSLASQTARATGEIASQIKAMQSAACTAVDSIQAIGHVVEEMNTVAAAIADAVEQQREATHEIAGNVSRAAVGTRDVALNIGGVDQAAQESGQAAGEVLDAARGLACQASLLETFVDDLITRSRAA